MPIINHATLGRASSVKVTKLDHRSIPNHYDPPLRRAVSVKKNNSMTSSMTRIGDSSDGSPEVVYAKPTMVRINTLLKKDASGTVKRVQVRTVIDEEQPPETNFYTATPPKSQADTSQLSSIPSLNSSHSSFGDGSITVFLEPSNVEKTP